MLVGEQRLSNVAILCRPIITPKRKDGKEVKAVLSMR